MPTSEPFASIPTQSAQSQLHFVAIDLETTGFSPRLDRVVEIAAIRFDLQGRVLAEYETLINPDRDLGATHVHHITADMLVDAPRFEEILGDITHIAREAVMVAHNADFDLRLLNAELQRAGHAPLAAHPLCTLHLSRTLAPHLACHRLQEMCRCWNLSVEGNWHCARADAQAARQLFLACLQQMSTREQNNLLRHAAQWAHDAQWPEVAPSSICVTRPQGETAAPSPLAAVIDRLSQREAGTPRAERYLEALDAALYDRIITQDEADHLGRLAADLGLSANQVQSLHRDYVRDLIQTALADDILTQNERGDLQQVAALLGVDSTSLESMIATPQPAQPASRLEAHRPSLEGKTICFTGQLRRLVNGQPANRQIAQETAQRHGMVVAKGVTKKLDYLVVADPHTLSGKAKKARQYETEILAEPVFWRLMRVQFE